MQPTTDNIATVLAMDFKAKYDTDYQDAAGWKDIIAAICGYNQGQFAPVKLRAMWAYYISDEREMKEFGASAVRFTTPRLLMKLAARVHITPAGKVAVRQYQQYLCVNNYAVWCAIDNTSFMNSMKAAFCHYMITTADAPPSKCPVCGGLLRLFQGWPDDEDADHREVKSVVNDAASEFDDMDWLGEEDFT